jgi:hypothetical protein
MTFQENLMKRSGNTYMQKCYEETTTDFLYSRNGYTSMRDDSTVTSHEKLPVDAELLLHADRQSVMKLTGVFAGRDTDCWVICHTSIIDTFRENRRAIQTI